MPTRCSMLLVVVPSIVIGLACSNQGSGGKGGQSTLSSSAGGAVGEGATRTGGAGSLGTPPSGDSSGTFTSVSMGGNLDACCGVKTDQSLACWGQLPFDQSVIPSGAFITVDLAINFACGIKTNGALVCWGYGAPSPTPGAFTSVSVGSGGACAVRTDGSVACWGDSPDLTSASPQGPFTSVSVNGALACALRTNGTVACWGSPSPAEIPGGTFSSFSVGFPMMCGVRDADGTIACFVRGKSGCSQDGVIDCVDATPPPGTFISVSAGANFACGVRTDGDIVCWGIRTSSVLPAGTYASVSVGTDDGLCGERTDGTLACAYTGHGGSGGPGTSH